MRMLQTGCVCRAWRDAPPCVMGHDDTNGVLHGAPSHCAYAVLVRGRRAACHWQPWNVGCGEREELGEGWRGGNGVESGARGAGSSWLSSEPRLPARVIYRPSCELRKLPSNSSVPFPARLNDHAPAISQTTGAPCNFVFLVLTAISAEATRRDNTDGIHVPKG